VGSTTGIIKYAGQTAAREIIVGTEQGVFCQLKKQNPDKVFIPASSRMTCADMKKITLEDIHAALTDMKHIVRVPEEVRIPAKRALDRMLALS
jgi:quinolinate synthase